MVEVRVPASTANMGTGFDHYIPLVGTIFITSVISNTISVLGFWSPTADLMTELGWALVVFVIITYHEIKAAGFGAYLKGFLDPLFVLAPINVMAECFTPISMACRHFGNILSNNLQWHFYHLCCFYIQYIIMFKLFRIFIMILILGRTPM